MTGKTVNAMQVHRRLLRSAGALFCLPTALGLGGCSTGVPTTEVSIPVEPWSDEGLSGRRLISTHFDIISTLRDAEFEAALPGFLETAYERYRATLPVPADRAARLTTYVFGTRSEWLRYVRRRFPARSDVYLRIRSGGFTEGDTSVSFHVNRAATLATLAHEGWHQYVGSRLEAVIPAWLNEGLACYHEAVELAGVDARFTPRHNTFRINALREAVQSDRLLTLSEIVHTDAGQVVGRHDTATANLYYAQAWALVTFLRHGAGGRFSGAFDRLLNDMAGGTFGVQISAARLGLADGAALGLGEVALRAYFGSSSAELQGEYYDHLIRTCGY